MKKLKESVTDEKLNDKTNLKDSLLTGMKVVLRNGEGYIVM